ncbi:unnamed protein product [Spirodela intermedia]|uniref:Uncharacterized protein n=1 Tax=Spirodela intermedia TaxID=51605 RepID=A0A7I8I9I8_SPIIN|nr:unnamed protein product [Spirodela intermedia]CAA6654309.1 unnamed protein product [Spirodela intermedia]
MPTAPSPSQPQRHGGGRWCSCWLLSPPASWWGLAAAGKVGEAPSGGLSAYEVLRSYNFPVGILPKGVVGYDLDATTGAFSVRLNGTCSFAVQDSYELRYQSTISGRISENQLSKLNGVSVKVVFFWLDIVKLTRKEDELEFSVGIISASFTIDNFLESPSAVADLTVSTCCSCPRGRRPHGPTGERQPDAPEASSLRIKLIIRSRSMAAVKHPLPD